MAKRFFTLFSAVIVLTLPLMGLESSFEGNIRAGYIYYASSGEYNGDAGALGGKLLSNSTLFNGVSLTIGLYYSQLFYNTDSSNVAPDFVDGDAKSFALLGQAALEGNVNDHHIVVGRQQIDTPHADSDDIRITPNMFQAYRYYYEGLSDTIFEVVYFTHMAGWENGVDTKTFVSMHDVVGISDASGNAISKGMGMAHAGYESETLQCNIYDYYLFGAYNILYMDVAYTQQLSDIVSMNLALQYNGNMGWTTFQNAGVVTSNVNAHLIGMIAGVALDTIGLEANFAMTLGVGNDPIAGSWGAGPYYTSMESMTFDAIGDAKGAAYLGSVSQTTGIEGLSIGYAYGHFQGATQASYFLSEHNVAIIYESEKDMKYYIGLALGKDWVTAANSYEFAYAVVEFPVAMLEQ